MAEIVAGFLAPILRRQFNYLCCFTTNITNLKNEAQKLQDTERDLQGKVDTARNDVRVISGEVETWLQNSKDIKDEMDGIINEVPNVEGGCLKLRARFSLSRRAKKTTDRLKELQDQCKFNDNSISLPGPPPAMKAVPSDSSYEFKSRKQIEEDIMTTLRGEDVKMIGICGMGGLGKTTMAKRIMNRGLEEHVFEEVVMAFVSRPIDKLKIQLEIGGSLGLKLEGETSQARVQKLHARLSGPKRILLVLDDVWERFQPEDLGIPCDCKGCTILLTSRNRDVLSVMNVQKIFGMDLLSKEDSWLLFRMRAGQCVDDTELNSIAKEVVSECAGLPIVLTTVGAAIKDEVDVYIWKNALQRLKRNCTPVIPEYIAEVYIPLKLSYDVLELNCQDVFLLCCLYPEDAHIPLEQLTYFCMGLHLLGGAIGNVEAARNRIRALSKVLKSRSLLLDSERGDDYVRMHDVVRDVCIYIAKHEGYIGGKDLTSSLQIYKLHSGFELLQIRNSDEEINFDGITDLCVLSIEWCSQLTSLPFTQRPNNLITLVLDSCERLETLSVVGELVNLKILICRNCDSIEELPPEIKGLYRLKVLELTRCGNLQRIGRGIISSLVGLEELKMLKSFTKWEAEDREERENAELRELGQLPNLRCLEIEIEDLALAAENIRLSSEVDRFTIRFLCESPILTNIFDEYLSQKKMRLYWKGETSLGHWIMQLLSDNECLVLDGNGANNVDLTKLENIKMLVLSDCESMKNVVTTSVDDGGANVFPLIDHLYLSKLPRLEEICDGRILLNSFQNLKKLKLSYLPVLKELWRCSQNDLGKDCLPQLEVLEISFCEMMEQVFSWEGEDGNENISCYHHITKIFPKLKELELMHMPNLISFCQGIEYIEFPVLSTIMIEKCGKMKGMVANGMRSSNENNLRGSSNAGIHLFCSQQVSFGCLKKLRTDQIPLCSHEIHVSLFNGLEELNISNCVGSLSLFESSIAGNLVNLKELQIADCDEMVQVIIMDDEKKVMSGGLRALIFPKLQTLCLSNLPKLVSFCELKCDVDFPSLREVEISGCNNMKSCTWGPLNTPNLKIVRINGQDLDARKNLNGMLQQLYLSRAEKLEFHGESQVVDEATHVADAEFSGEQQGTEPTSTKAERSKHHEQIQVVDEATHVAYAEFFGEQQGTDPTSSKAERSKHHIQIQVVDEATHVADAEFSGEQQRTEPTSSKAERSKHHVEIQVVDEATPVADAEFSGEQQGTEPTSSEAERNKHHREIQVVDEATPVVDAEFSGEQQGTEPTSSEAERSKHHREIQVVDEATPVADAEFSGEQQGTKPTSSKAEKSNHYQECSLAPCLFEEKGHYMIGEENNHLQLKLDNEILSISIGDYPSSAPPHNFPVNAMLDFVEQDLRELLERPDSSNLLLLFLQRNKRLTVIHPSFFDSMPDLHFLDISDTKIRTLPSSLFKLSKLKVLMLRNCVCLENLPPEIGNLYNMEALDLSGTELYNLPDEIGELTLLRSLQLSLYGPDDESEYDHLPTQLVSPSFLSKLKEIRSLSISVHPEDYRWAKIVSGILKDISKLEMLSYLRFYSPEVEAFEDFIRTSPSWKNQEVSKFDFIVGQNVKRVVSRVPDEVESLFNQQERCLRYVNGDKASPLIKTVLNRATAFYLDHHTEVQSLSEFNNSSLQALKFCVVRECPKIQAILDGKNAGSEFPCLEHLGIYFLWELKHIWKLPSPTGRLKRFFKTPGRLKRFFKTPTSSGNSAALRSLIISTCPKLQFVFWESMLQSLINLKELVVEDCECMETIIKEENKKVKYEDNVLPGLTRLVLHYLPMLVSVGNDALLSKENISIHGCPNIRPSQP